MKKIRYLKANNKRRIKAEIAIYDGIKNAMESKQLKTNHNDRK